MDKIHFLTIKSKPVVPCGIEKVRNYFIIFAILTMKPAVKTNRLFLFFFFFKPLLVRAEVSNIRSRGQNWPSKGSKTTLLIKASLNDIQTENFLWFKKNFLFYNYRIVWAVTELLIFLFYAFISYNLSPEFCWQTSFPTVTLLLYVGKLRYCWNYIYFSYNCISQQINT